MYIAPAKHLHQLVAGLLQSQPLTHHFTMLTRHLDHVREIEEGECVQHHDMQRMTADRFAAVDEAAQCAKLPADLDPKGIFNRMHRTHLVGNRADAADASHVIGQPGHMPATRDAPDGSARMTTTTLDQI